jgi:pyridoxal phosphate-dependent aminotransferase EpsN
LIDKDVAGVDRHAVEKALAAEDVESRPLWKPMHRQPVFRDAERVVTGVSDGLFERGLCLPSGSNLSSDDQARVIGVLRGLWPS